MNSNSKFSLKSNYHTHTYLCRHAEGNASDYVNLAIQNGYHTIGISDHGPLLNELTKQFYSRRMSFNEYYDEYLPQIMTAKNKYSEQISILGAIEIEFLPPMLTHYRRFKHELDYMILGQHHFYHNKKYISVYDKMNDESIRGYVKSVTEAMDTGLFAIFAHPDIFLLNYPKWDKICVDMTNTIISSAIKNNVILEINANGIRNSIRDNHPVYIESEGHNFGYPRKEFWNLVSRSNVKVLLSDDSHYFNKFNDQYTYQAYQFALELNIKLLNDVTGLIKPL